MPSCIEDKKPTSLFEDEKKLMLKYWVDGFERANRNFSDGASNIADFCYSEEDFPYCGERATVIALSEESAMKVRFPRVDLSKHHQIPNVRVLSGGVTWATEGVGFRFEVPPVLYGELANQIDDFIGAGYAKADCCEWFVGGMISKEELGATLDQLLGVAGYDTKGKQKHMHIVLGLK